MTNDPRAFRRTTFTRLCFYKLPDNRSSFWGKILDFGGMLLGQFTKKPGFFSRLSTPGFSGVLMLTGIQFYRLNLDQRLPLLRAGQNSTSAHRLPIPAANGPDNFPIIQSASPRVQLKVLSLLIAIRSYPVTLSNKPANVGRHWLRF